MSWQSSFTSLYSQDCTDIWGIPSIYYNQPVDGNNDAYRVLNSRTLGLSLPRRFEVPDRCAECLDPEPRPYTREAQLEDLRHILHYTIPQGGLDPRKYHQSYEGLRLNSSCPRRTHEGITHFTTKDNLEDLARTTIYWKSMYRRSHQYFTPDPSGKELDERMARTSYLPGRPQWLCSGARREDKIESDVSGQRGRKGKERAEARQNSSSSDEWTDVFRRTQKHPGRPPWLCSEIKREDKTESDASKQ
ncbi:uncharacterized protein L3040_000705 [Drepanopeziza brunnea f. sp. 'multigermtubi']|nr:hypothetical protein L3040_000705 [Drepanopeziza brunnea f. sp. 'multigermtubi']